MQQLVGELFNEINSEVLEDISRDIEDLLVDSWASFRPKLFLNASAKIEIFGVPLAEELFFELELGTDGFGMGFAIDVGTLIRVAGALTGAAATVVGGGLAVRGGPGE